MIPLRIRAQTLSPVSVDPASGAINLDAVLAWAAINDLPCVPLDKSAECWVTPIPARVLYIHERKPVWAVSYLIPDHRPTVSMEYWHGRYPEDRSEFAGKPNVNKKAGRYKSWRVPLQVIAPCTWEATVIGVETEIRRLLASVSHVGKKSSAGYGRVCWSVESGGTDITEDSISRRRVMPIEFYHGRNVDELSLRPASGYTPPYWYRPWHGPCLVPQIGSLGG